MSNDMFLGFYKLHAFRNGIFSVTIASLLTIVATAEQCLSTGTIQSGKVLKGSNFTKISHSSIYSCAGACFGYSFCKSFHFKKKTKTCFLNYADATTEQIIQEENPDFIYGSIASWPKSIAGPCRGHVCKKEERCKVTRTNTATCVASPSYGVDYTVEHVLSSEKRTWSVAVDECSNMHGNLAVVDTQEKSDNIKRIIQAQGLTDYVWLGATEAGFNGRWMWVDGQEMTFNMWSPYYNQPRDTFGKEECLAVRYKDQATFWDWFDKICGDEAIYLCEVISLL